MHINPQEMHSLRTALRTALNVVEILDDPRTDQEKDSVPPPIGGKWLGGIYVGKTLDGNNEPAQLVLLPDEFEGNWKNAGEWAEKRGGTLPSRVDLLVLWLTARDHFKTEWYWSSETHHQYPEYAWSQGFTYGGQDDDRKTSKLRARAVRRVSIR